MSEIIANNTEIPHAIDAERAVLGALLINNQLFEELEEGMQVNWLYDGRHRVMYQLMLELNAQGYVDPPLLARKLQEAGDLKKGGGEEYIAEIADIGAAPINVPTYVNLIREMAFRRDILAALNTSIGKVYHPGKNTPETLLDTAESSLSAVSDVFMRGYGGFFEASRLANDYFDLMAGIAASGDYSSLKGLETGYPAFDKLTAGLHKGELSILAGRPGAGKTAFALNLVRNVAMRNERIGIICFSLEMSSSQLVQRMMAHSGINVHRFRTGTKLNSEDLTLLAAASSELSEMKIFIDDSSLLNVLDARIRARRVKREMKLQGVELGLIMIDYLQLMNANIGDRNETRAHEVAIISRGLKALAKELNVPVLACAQLNRGIESRTEKTPQLSDLRESGAIEQDADVILFLHYDKDDKNQNENSDISNVKLTIGKHRNGPTGELDLRFDKKFSKFTELISDWESQQYE